jgi:hypothetical protein
LSPIKTFSSSSVLNAKLYLAQERTIYEIVRPSDDHRVNVLYLINQSIRHNMKREWYEAEGGDMFGHIMTRSKSYMFHFQPATTAVKILTQFWIDFRII